MVIVGVNEQKYTLLVIIGDNGNSEKIGRFLHNWYIKNLPSPRKAERKISSFSHTKFGNFFQ